MTTSEFQKRKKIVKTIGWSLTGAGIILPIIFLPKGSKIFMSIVGGIIGLIIFGGIAATALPGPDTKLT